MNAVPEEIPRWITSDELGAGVRYIRQSVRARIIDYIVEKAKGVEQLASERIAGLDDGQSGGWLQAETWLLGENLGKEIDENLDLAGQEPAARPDRADR